MTITCKNLKRLSTKYCRKEITNLSNVVFKTLIFNFYYHFFSNPRSSRISLRKRTISRNNLAFLMSSLGAQDRVKKWGWHSRDPVPLSNTNKWCIYSSILHFNLGLFGKRLEASLVGCTVMGLNYGLGP